MFHGGEDVGIGVTTHHVVHLIVTPRCQANVHGIGGAKKVVEVAHHFLIGTPQEHADQIRLVRLEAMEF